ncbi:unnamed protein product [Blepharisma stoltei]|uniref:Uncharacterized protein n=1 Tax=Blepharisma stoltei TaxID=1481888 RepID=A0AAU9IM93_9CILI|nr:unnamed protein product [Blepharisma stoltei]
MKKNSIIALSDPNFKKKQEIRRIQPLFRKQFQSPRSSLTSLVSPTNQPPSTSNFLQIDSMSPAGVRPETAEPVLHSDAHIESEIKRLIGERISLIRELVTYGEKYENKLCMKARFSQMLGYCQKLDSMVKDAGSHIKQEKELFDKLESGLGVIRSQEKNKERLSPMKNYEESPPDTEEGLEHQHCVDISGVTCLAYIRANRDMSEFEVNIHVDISCEVFTYEFKQFRFSIPEVVIGGRFLSLAVEWDLFPHFYFTSENGSLKLGFDREYGIHKIYIIAKIRGFYFQQVCVMLTEKSDSFILSIEEPSISKSPIKAEVAKERLKLDSSAELISSSRRKAFKHLLEEKLSLLKDDGGLKLTWGSSLWDMEKRLNKRKSDIRKTMFSFFNVKADPGLYSDYDVLMHQDKININGNKGLVVSIKINTILDLLRLEIKYDNLSRIIKEEDYREDFLFLKSLSFDGEIQYATLFRSLEFEYFIRQISMSR